MVMERISSINGVLDQKVRWAKDTYKLLIAGVQNSLVNSIFQDRTRASQIHLYDWQMFIMIFNNFKHTSF